MYMTTRSPGPTPLSVAARDSTTRPQNSWPRMRGGWILASPWRYVRRSVPQTVQAVDFQEHFAFVEAGVRDFLHRELLFAEVNGCFHIEGFLSADFSASWRMLVDDLVHGSLRRL